MRQSYEPQTNNIRTTLPQVDLYLTNDHTPDVIFPTISLSASIDMNRSGMASHAISILHELPRALYLMYTIMSSQAQEIYEL